ncbi:hypothetical protein Tco_1234806 [Tanacetum coccineum]
MTTLAEFMILCGGDNRPSMLDKNLYDSWQSRMELYMENKEHEIQADCDVKATNIILQGLPSDVYALVNHHKIPKDLWERMQLLMQDSGLVVPVFKQGDDLINAINKMMSFLSTVVTSRFPTTKSQLRNSSNPRQQATIHDRRTVPKAKEKRDATWFKDKVLLVEAQGSSKVLNEEELVFLADLGVAEGPVIQTGITHYAAYQVDDLDAYDSDCDEISIVKAVLMANLSSYGLDVLFEYHTLIILIMISLFKVCKRCCILNILKLWIIQNMRYNDSNIIMYSRYLLETQNADVQDTNSPAQQDAMILSVFEQLQLERRQRLPTFEENSTWSPREITLYLLFVFYRTMAGVDIDTLTMEQYLALPRENQAPGVVKPKIRGNVNFKIKSQFMCELMEDTFSRNKDDDAQDHIDRVLSIVSLFNIPGVSKDAVML